MTPDESTEGFVPHEGPKAPLSFSAPDGRELARKIAFWLQCKSEEENRMARNAVGVMAAHHAGIGRKLFYIARAIRGATIEITAGEAGSDP